MDNWKIISAENAVLGRLASIVAERLLKDEKIIIVNAERAIVNGTRKGILQRYINRKNLKVKGNPLKGPRFHASPNSLVKAAIKGMLPMKSSRGKKALRKVRIFVGIPKEFEGKEIEKITKALQRRKRYYMRVGQISKLLGAKW